MSLSYPEAPSLRRESLFSRTLTSLKTSLNSPGGEWRMKSDAMRTLKTIDMLTLTCIRENQHKWHSARAEKIVQDLKISEARLFSEFLRKTKAQVSVIELKIEKVLELKVIINSMTGRLLCQVGVVPSLSRCLSHPKSAHYDRITWEMHFWVIGLDC